MNNSITMIMYGKSVGGAELQFIELANYLSEKNRVRLVCLGGDTCLKSTSINDCINLKVYTYNKKYYFILAFLNEIFNKLNCKSTIIITTSFIGNVLGYLISLRTNSRIISLQTVSRCMRRPLIDRFVLKRFDVLVAGAEDIKKYLINHIGLSSNIEVVHNWVDFSKRTTSQKSVDVRLKFGLKDCTVIGCIGRLHPQKGQIFLIEAFSVVYRYLPNCRLILVGDGDDMSKLKLRIRQLDLQDQVIFTGSVKGNNYNEMFSAIDIYVQPSIFEGLPRTLLDAMYYGKPIIASNINGNSEAIISGENGLLVESQNVTELVDNIMKLALDKVFRDTLGSNAKKFVHEHFEMRSQLLRIENLISKEIYSDKITKIH